MKIDRLDRLAPTVADIGAACAFYERALGMSVESFGEGGRRWPLGGGRSVCIKPGGSLNRGRSGRRRGRRTFASSQKQDEVAHSLRCGMTIIECLAERTGALGRTVSIYFRDPDLILIEASHYSD